MSRGFYIAQMETPYKLKTVQVFKKIVKKIEISCKKDNQEENIWQN